MSNKLRQELQSYFDRVYPQAKIENESSIVDNISIMFELGG